MKLSGEVLLTRLVEEWLSWDQNIFWKKAGKVIRIMMVGRGQQIGTSNQDASEVNWSKIGLFCCWLVEISVKYEEFRRYPS